MATREWQFWGQYNLPYPPLLALWVHMDGVEMNGGLFEHNTPVTDGILRVVVAPTSSDLCVKTLAVRIPTYEWGPQGGAMIYKDRTFTWEPLTMDSQSWLLDYNGHPYGMGLNVLQVTLGAVPPVTKTLWWNVLWTFTMEVG